MNINRVEVAGLASVALAALIFSALIIEYDFPVFKFEEDKTADPVKNETAKIGQEVSLFLWDYRTIDLIAQAFVLFATAACCAALLKTEEKKK